MKLLMPCVLLLPVVCAGVIHRKPDAAPNDPAAFEVRDHFAVPVAASAQ